MKLLLKKNLLFSRSNIYIFFVYLSLNKENLQIYE